MGIFRRLAEITDRQEFVSPYIKTASGFSFSKTSSDFAITFAIVFAAFSAAASRK